MLTNKLLLRTVNEQTHSAYWRLSGNESSALLLFKEFPGVKNWKKNLKLSVTCGNRDKYARQRHAWTRATTCTSVSSSNISKVIIASTYATDNHICKMYSADQQAPAPDFILFYKRTSFNLKAELCGIILAMSQTKWSQWHLLYFHYITVIK